MRRQYIILTLLFTFFSLAIQAQNTAWLDINHAYKSGKELLDKGKFTAAAHMPSRAQIWVYLEKMLNSILLFAHWNWEHQMPSLCFWVLLTNIRQITILNLPSTILVALTLHKKTMKKLLNGWLNWRVIIFLAKNLLNTDLNWPTPILRLKSTTKPNPYLRN